jgi:hypothetical protein
MVVIADVQDEFELTALLLLLYMHTELGQTLAFAL